jgi:hypothetical protein
MTSIEDRENQLTETPRLNQAETSQKGQFRRVFEVTLFVGAWILIGCVLHLDANSYLLIGLPITFIYQIVVAKAPLRTLWVLAAPQMKIHQTRLAAKIIGLGFAAANAVLIYEVVASGYWIGAAYEGVEIVGSIPLAYAISNFTRSTIRPLLMTLATAGSFGIGMFLLTYAHSVYYLNVQPAVSVGSFALSALVSLVQYVPAIFMLEEVSFRAPSIATFTALEKRGQR